MAQRALNKAQLIGNLTRDPELRYTPSGTAVCTFGLATNRTWSTETNERKEDVEFHRLVAWNKLAEICSQLLFKGRRVYIEGRLQTREWTGKDGVNRQTTEIVVSDMIILDSKRQAVDSGDSASMEPREKPKPVMTSKPKVEKPEPQPKTEAEDTGKQTGKAGAKAAAKTSDDDDQKKPKSQAKKKAEPESETEVKPEDIPF